MRKIGVVQIDAANMELATRVAEVLADYHFGNVFENIRYWEDISGITSRWVVYAEYPHEGFERHQNHVIEILLPVVVGPREFGCHFIHFIRRAFALD